MYNNFKSKLLIIDRLDNLKKKEIIKLKKNHQKIILIDSVSKYIKYSDLNLNPHIKNKYTKKNFGLEYLILPEGKINVYEDDLEDIYSSRTFCLHEDIDQILCLGDCFALGPEPEETLKMLQKVFTLLLKD